MNACNENYEKETHVQRVLKKQYELKKIEHQ